MTTITYKELARRVGDCVLNNEIHGVIEDFEIYSGEVDYCYVHDTKEECEEKEEECRYENIEIYQEYVISESGAEYLQRNTNEIVWYSESINMYLWAITHFGTSWDGVDVTIKD